MQFFEFTTTAGDGIIRIPEEYVNQILGEVKVSLVVVDEPVVEPVKKEVAPAVESPAEAFDYNEWRKKQALFRFNSGDGVEAAKRISQEEQEK